MRETFNESQVRDQVPFGESADHRIDHLRRVALTEQLSRELGATVFATAEQLDRRDLGRPKAILAGSRVNG